MDYEKAWKTLKMWLEDNVKKDLRSGEQLGTGYITYQLMKALEGEQDYEYEEFFKDFLD